MANALTGAGYDRNTFACHQLVSVAWIDGSGRRSRFIAVFAHSLEHTGGFAPEEAKRVAATLLPDHLRYDPTRPASYPQNGRTLTDDAADAFLTVITNGKVTGDGIGPHSDLLDEFPYLGPPHTTRSSRV